MYVICSTTNKKVARYYNLGCNIGISSQFHKKKKFYIYCNCGISQDFPDYKLAKKLCLWFDKFNDEEFNLREIHQADTQLCCWLQSQSL